MIQIALKAFKRLGLDCHRFMHLRDNRLIRYKDSLLAMARLAYARIQFISIVVQISHLIQLTLEY